MSQLNWRRVDSELYRADHEFGQFEIVKVKNPTWVWRALGPGGFTREQRTLEDVKLEVERGLPYIKFDMERAQHEEELAERWRELEPVLRLLPHKSTQRSAAGETRWDYLCWLESHTPQRVEGAAEESLDLMEVEHLQLLGQGMAELVFKIRTFREELR